MPKFAANLSMMFGEVAFLDRFAAAAAAGFTGVEFLFPYDHDAARLAATARAAGVEIVLFNLPPGDWAGGERGIAALPGRGDEHARGVEHALDYARGLGVRRLHAMAGIGGDRATYLAALTVARARADTAEATLLVEPINRRDMPGYHLATFEDARGVAAATGARVQADLYHMQIEGGDLTTRLRDGIADIGHIQVAGVPARHEPDSGEVDCHRLFALLDDLGYDGWVGCEYRPAAGTVAGLGWFDRYR